MTPRSLSSWPQLAQHSFSLLAQSHEINTKWCVSISLGELGGVCLFRQQGSLGEGTFRRAEVPSLPAHSLISVSGLQLLANCSLIPQSQEALASLALFPAARHPATLSFDRDCLQQPSGRQAQFHLPLIRNTQGGTREGQL